MLELSRAEILDRFRKSLAEGNILLGVGAGTGITAKSAEAGGADIFVIYNSGRFRMAGRGSLAGLLSYGDANQIVVEMGSEVLPVVKDTPVLAGVCGTDPFRVMSRFLKELKDQGFNGVQNFPTVGLIDGVFRKNLEETGMGYDLEVDMIAEAHKLDMLTCPYVFDEEQAAAMTKAGADIVVAHMGLTTGGTIGAETARTLDDCVEIIAGIAKVVKDINPDALVICHGGPISEPKDAAYIIERVARWTASSAPRPSSVWLRARHQGADGSVQGHQKVRAFGEYLQGRRVLEKGAPSFRSFANRTRPRARLCGRVYGKAAGSGSRGSCREPKDFSAALDLLTQG